MEPTEHTTPSTAREGAAAAALFAFAGAAFLALGGSASPAGSRAGALPLFAVLVGGYLALSVRALRGALGARLPAGPVLLLAGPGAVLGAALLYSAAAGLPLGVRAGAYGAYVLLPALLLAPGIAPPGRLPARALGAALLLWLPIELDLLPPLPLPAPGGLDAARLLGLCTGLYLFLVARPLPAVGYTFHLTRAEGAVALRAFAAYAPLALPVGLATGFLAWGPDLSPERLLALPAIFLLTAVPEEFLFRGLIQNLLARRWGPRVALGIASVVFGLAHLPDPRYVLLAAFAGVAYGWAYQRTGKITAAAVTHALVDWVWVLALRG